MVDFRVDSFWNGSGTGISESEPRPAIPLTILQHVWLTLDTLLAYSWTSYLYWLISSGTIRCEVPMSDRLLLRSLGVEYLYDEFLTVLYFISLLVSFLIFYGITHHFVSPLAKKDWTKFSWAGYAVYLLFVFMFHAFTLRQIQLEMGRRAMMSKVIPMIWKSITLGVLGGMVLAKITNLVVKPLLRGYVVMLGVTLDNPKKRKFVLIKRKSNAIVEAVKEFWEKERDWIH
jgi:hypothetical protein